MSLVRTSNAWTQAQNFHARQKYYNTRALSNTAALSDELGGTLTAQTENQTTVMTQIALARIQQETAAKQAKAKKQADALTVPTTSYEKIMKKYDSAHRAVTQNFGGMDINYSNKLLTLSDGTVIDLETGRKKITVSARKLYLSNGQALDLTTGKLINASV